MGHAFQSHSPVATPSGLPGRFISGRYGHGGVAPDCVTLASVMLLTCLLEGANNGRFYVRLRLRFR